MAKVLARTYLSPTLVLLAFDWPDGKDHADFLGFAIKRDPGHGEEGRPDFLFNKIAFHPLTSGERPHPSDRAPIQKFHWWDAGIETKDRGRQFSYTIYPVRGTGEHDLRLVPEDAATVQVKVPREEENGVGTYFNRAVVSSQGFLSYARKVNGDLDKEMEWLANGLGDAISRFLDGAHDVVGAIYHLTDKKWVVPVLGQMVGTLSMVYHLKQTSSGKNDDTTNLPAVKLLASPKRRFEKRTRTAIMHHKFLVRDVDGPAAGVLMGSTNFTPEAFTAQANLLHTFRSPQMAQLYKARHDLLAPDPPKGQTAQGAAWHDVNDVSGTKIRVFLSPEPTKKRVSIDAVVKAVQAAQQSVLFCLFAPTDPALLKALLAAGDKKKMMYGLLNSIQDPTKPRKETVLDPQAATLAAKARYQVQTEVFHRSKGQHDVVAFDYFHEGRAPRAFLPELSAINTSAKSLKPPSDKVPTVHVHHKFIVIDGETKNPTIYTGSANMSDNSVHNNDENLLEITGNTRLAEVYVAEFLRLYEHYRTRAIWEQEHNPKRGAKTPRAKRKSGHGATAFVLKTNRKAWVGDAYKPGMLDFIARKQLVAPA